MKDLLIEFSSLVRVTLGVSVDISVLKTGEYKVKFNRGNDVSAENRPSFRDPEDAIKDAIKYLHEKRRPIRQFTPGLPPEATHTIKRETAW